MSNDVNIDEFDFSGFVPVVIPVKGPDGVDYELVQANGEIGTWYNNLRLQKITGKNDNGIVGLADLEQLLVGKCLRYSAKHESKPLLPVPVGLTKSWPYPVQKKLAEKAIDISGLNAATESVLEVFKKALNNPDAPVTIDALVEWINKLDPNDGFEGLQTMFKDYKPKK